MQWYGNIKIDLVSVFCRTEKVRVVFHCLEHDCSHPLGWCTCMVPVVTVIVRGIGYLSSGHTSVGIWLLGGVVSVGHCLLWSFALHRVAQCYNIQIFRKMSATLLFSKNFQ